MDTCNQLYTLSAPVLRGEEKVRKCWARENCRWEIAFVCLLVHNPAVGCGVSIEAKILRLIHKPL